MDPESQGGRRGQRLAAMTAGDHDVSAALMQRVQSVAGDVKESSLWPEVLQADGWEKMVDGSWKLPSVGSLFTWPQGFLFGLPLGRADGLGDRRGRHRRRGSWFDERKKEGKPMSATDATDAYRELVQRERDREDTYLDNGAPEDVEYLRASGATRASEHAAIWIFPDGTSLRRGAGGRLYTA